MDESCWWCGAPDPAGDGGCLWCGIDQDDLDELRWLPGVGVVFRRVEDVTVVGGVL